MITDILQIRPRYGEVDQMGYVYHANYVTYCHQARTELLRKFGLNDKVLEDNEIILPVISINLEYRKPAHYDEQLEIKTVVNKLPDVRFKFEFEMYNNKKELVCTANSSVVFVDSISRSPMRIPELVHNALKTHF